MYYPFKTSSPWVKSLFILFAIAVFAPLIFMGCKNLPSNNKIHENVKITVLDAYYDAPSGATNTTRLIAMTSIRPYPVVIKVDNHVGIIDELTLVRMFKTVENFTFKATILLEDLNIENSMGFYMDGANIVLFPNNNVELKSGYSVINDDMSPITLPTKRNGQMKGAPFGPAGANASNTNTFTINVNGDEQKH